MNERAIGYVAGRVTGGSARAGCNASLQETSSCGFAGQKSSKGETHVVRAGRVVRSGPCLVEVWKCFDEREMIL